MMKWIKGILFPFALLYNAITAIRNFFYDQGILRSTSFDIPIICVGNLNVGGTGKSPMVEYLIRLLKEDHQLATLSRGYKRKSTGFQIGGKDTTIDTLGDEPFQFFRKFPDIAVAVDAHRVHGIQRILELKPDIDVVVLDDAFQHRKVRPGFSILLTAYDDPYYADWHLPMGFLRESISGRKRADLIVVTKCPQNLSKEEQERMKRKLKPYSGQEVFFTKIAYAEEVFGSDQSMQLSALKDDTFVLVTGIANPKPMIDFLAEKAYTFEHLKFPDHHNFSEADIERIITIAEGKKILTTEKDFVRLQKRLAKASLFYLPIETSFIEDKALFDEKLLGYIKEEVRPSRSH